MVPRTLIFIYLILNLLNPIFSSLPLEWQKHVQLPHAVSDYFFYTGLNNRWTMFSNVPKGQFRTYYDAITESDESITLPVLFQNKSVSALHRTLFDFKYEKFDLNLWSRPAMRQKYARYLCRQFPTVEGSPVRQIRIDRTYLPFYPREKVTMTNKYEEEFRTVVQTELVNCQTAAEPT